MIIKFEIPIKAFSINAYHYANRKIKTKEARAWEELFLLHIPADAALQMKTMSKKFEQFGGSFNLHLTFGYPKEIFFNKDEEISARTFDLSNVEKPIMDLLFLRTMKVDDRFVNKLTSKKECADYYKIKIHISYSQISLYPGKSQAPTINLP